MYCEEPIVNVTFKNAKNNANANIFSKYAINNNNDNIHLIHFSCYKAFLFKIWAMKHDGLFFQVSWVHAKFFENFQFCPAKMTQLQLRSMEDDATNIIHCVISTSEK